jgi:succinate dehydrogenase hydrophobic anchor subunit
MSSKRANRYDESQIKQWTEQEARNFHTDRNRTVHEQSSDSGVTVVLIFNMVTVVLIFNLLVALLCGYVAWQVWRLRNALAKVADALTVAEQTTHEVLWNAPQGIAQQQIRTSQLRQDYTRLMLQLQKAQQVLTLLGLGQLALRRYQRNSQNSHSQNSYSRNFK